ncbi:MAG: hypothetical protein Q7T60_17155 [Sphingopyxis sp.]|nr:hypothetical protein [Sphingopyxis sp.]
MKCLNPNSRKRPQKGRKVENDVTVKAETTQGNVLSMLTTVGMSLLTLAATLVSVTLAYGWLVASDRMHDRRLDMIEAQMARSQVDDRAENVETTKRQTDIERRLSTMEGDIRVIRQIVSGERPVSR